ncbi:MAG: 4-hydroxy-tetrahydrodipicolinate reductase [Tannerella sp.]|jgi:4-hydroxy-tetrahydrodipicolinate reductase|nr:4-hydroxy-tetrahydrodipicolinate reductase [Tannerella sp.]
MKIALVGYGKMGHIIERIALERGHTIVSKIDINNPGDFASEAFRSADVAIEFTTPATAFDNYRKCFAAGIPVVSGTTGWTARMGEIKKQCEEEGQTFFYASNFSIGVNIFFAINRYLAKLMNGFPSYDVQMTEVHHIHKLDTPSGTGITLAEDILNEISRKKQWRLADHNTPFSQTKGDDRPGDTGNPEDLPIHAVREGEVPGIHEVRYESEADSITIRHDAKSRAGFALGAVLAAEFTAGKKGFLGMKEMLQLAVND